MTEKIEPQTSEFTLLNATGRSPSNEERAAGLRDPIPRVGLLLGDGRLLSACEAQNHAWEAYLLIRHEATRGDGGFVGSALAHIIDLHSFDPPLAVAVAPDQTTNLLTLFYLVPMLSSAGFTVVQPVYERTERHVPSCEPEDFLATDARWVVTTTFSGWQSLFPEGS